MIKVNKVKKMRKIKKKGSTFVIVVFITAILFTTATTMIAVVTNDYKTRVNESKKLENLYQSDAKLDVAYNVIAKNADRAVVYANNKVAQENKNKTIDPSINKQDFLNAQFQEYFFEFLGTQNLSNLSVDFEEPKNSTIPNESNVLAYGILTSKYKAFASTALNPTQEDLANKANYDFYNGVNEEDTQKETEEKNRQKGKLEITKYEYDSANKRIIVSLKSTFSTDTDVSKTSLNNQKTIETKYIINAPTYNQATSTGVNNSTEYQYAVQKAITADGNLNASSANVNIKGDVWIKGNDNDMKDNYDVAYKKYEQGIWLNNNSSFDVDGILATNNTLTLSNASKANISAELYAMNAYVGSLKREAVEKESGNNKLVSGNIVTNNDLVMNSADSEISTTKYYGISGLKESSSKADLGKSSSSIIVNKNKDSKIDISQDAYISGLAYMDNTTGKSYTTGESIGVKGNFEAYTYTEKLAEDQEFTIEQYDFNNLLVGLVESPDYLVKAKHFEQYYSKKQGDFSNGGIYIGAVHSIGTGANKNEVVQSADVNELDKIAEAQKDGQKNYGQYVYAMGNIVKGDMTAEDFYKYPSKMKTVENQVAFNEIEGKDLKGLYKAKDYTTANKEDNGYLLLSADQDSTLTISGTMVTLTDGNGKEVSSFDAKSRDENKINAVIITKGNVVFDGNVDYTGTVVAHGNVTFNENSKVNITHDADVINKVIAFNKDGYFSDKDNLFKGNPIDTTAQTVTVEVKLGVDAARDGWYDTTLLKKGLWKLEKEKGEVIEQ